VEVTPELAREGLAREVVRLIQDARKAAGLEVSDRVEVGLDAAEPVAEAVAAHRERIAAEVLATTIRDALLGADAHRETREMDGAVVTVSLRKA